MTPQGGSISTAMVEYAIPVMWWVGPIKECQLNLDLSLVYLLNNKKYKKKIIYFSNQISKQFGSFTSLLNKNNIDLI